VLDLSSSDVIAGIGGDFDITGSGHAHSITLSNEDLETIAAGGEVTVLSTEGGAGPHTHSVRVTCSAL
jgi:hypothetical protein